MNNKDNQFSSNQNSSKKGRKRYIKADLNFRHKIAGQRKADKSLFQFDKIQDTFMSVYPYENCIWNAFVVYEQKSKHYKEFNKSEVINYLKNEDNKLFHIILKNELNYDFDILFEKFEVEKKLYESYFTKLKDLLPQISLVFDCPLDKKIFQKERFKNVLNTYKQNLETNKQIYHINNLFKDSNTKKDISDLKKNGYLNFLEDFYKDQGVENKYLKEFFINKYKNMIATFHQKNKEVNDMFRDDKSNTNDKYGIDNKRVSGNYEYSDNEFFFFIQFFTCSLFFLAGLESKLFVDEMGKFNVDLYASENQFQVYAEELRYRLQLRIIAQTELLDYDVYEDNEKKLEEHLKQNPVKPVEDTDANEENEPLVVKPDDETALLVNNDKEEIEEKLNMANDQSECLIQDTQKLDNDVNDFQTKYSDKYKEMKDLDKVTSSFDKNTQELRANASEAVENSSNMINKIKENLSLDKVKDFTTNLYDNTIDKVVGLFKDSFFSSIDNAKGVINKVNPTNTMRQLTGKLSEFVIKDQDELFNNTEILSKDKVYLNNIVPSEYLSEDIANFPPYNMFKCCYQHQRLFKRFDKNDHYHLCDNCTDSNNSLISKIKCSIEDCKDSNCSKCFYLQYRCIVRNCKNYLEKNDQIYDLSDEALEKELCKADTTYINTKDVLEKAKNYDKMHSSHLHESQIIGSKASLLNEDNLENQDIYDQNIHHNHIYSLDKQLQENYFNSNLNIDSYGCNNYFSKEGSCSSIFRHLDKKRLVFYKMHNCFNFKTMKKKAEKNNKKKVLSLFKGVLLLYDYNNYITKLTSKLEDDELKQTKLFSKENKSSIKKEVLENNDNNNSILMNFVLSTYESPAVMSFIYTLRNFYGEEVAFYFAWVSYYVFILKYLAFYGTVLFMIMYIMQFFMTEETIQQYNLFLTVPFTFFVVFIGKIFGEMWLDKEKVLVYKWGMEDYDLEIENSNLEGDVIYNQFLDIKMPLVNEKKAFYMKIVVWMKCFVAYFLVILTNLIIFFLQYLLIDSFIRDFNDGNASLFETIFVYFVLIASPYLFLELRDYFSDKFFEKVRLWTISEQYPTRDDHQSSITFKFVCFQMINYYFNLYYTAFIKPLYQPCIYNDCRAEIGQQINIMFIIFILKDLYSFNKIKIKVEEQAKKITNKVNYNNSSKYEYYYRQSYANSVQSEYMQIILVFGYIIQFGAASPLCLLIGFVHGLLARFTDSYKFIKLNHVNFNSKYFLIYFFLLFYFNLIAGGKGIGFFNQMIKFMNTFGLFSNVGIILFADTQIINAYSLDERWKMMFIIENLLLIFVFFFRINFLPNWFDYSEKAKLGYLNSSYDEKTKLKAE